MRARRGPVIDHVQAAEVQPYTAADGGVRTDIQDADLLLFRGHSLTSRIIQVGTRSPYSHAALAFRSQQVDPFHTTWDAGRVCCLEAVGAGVRLGLLSEELARYDGAVELWRLKDPFVKRLLRELVIREARRYLGRPYAYGNLPSFVFDWLTLGYLQLRSRNRSRRAFFCSQLVSRAYVRGGVDLNVRYGDAATAPGDLVAGQRIELIHAFAKDDVVDRVSRTDLGQALSSTAAVIK